MEILFSPIAVRSVFLPKERKISLKERNVAVSFFPLREWTVFILREHHSQPLETTDRHPAAPALRICNPGPAAFEESSSPMATASSGAESSRIMTQVRSSIITQDSGAQPEVPYAAVHQIQPGHSVARRSNSRRSPASAFRGGPSAPAMGLGHAATSHVHRDWLML